MTDLERLIGLARITRSAFERVGAKDGWRHDLGGLCYDASCFLRRLALAHGIETEIGQGLGHWFVLYGDIVIDVTSTQFGRPEPVAVLPLEEASKLGQWWRLLGRHAEPPLWLTSIDHRVGDEVEDLMGLAVGEAEL